MQGRVGLKDPARILISRRKGVIGAAAKRGS